MGAVVSGLSAAWLCGLTKGHAPPPEVSARTERRLKEVKARRVRRLVKGDQAVWRGVPVTTAPATLARRRGDVLRRYTWRDLFEEPDQMLAELDDLLLA